MEPQDAGIPYLDDDDARAEKWLRRPGNKNFIVCDARCRCCRRAKSLLEPTPEVIAHCCDCNLKPEKRDPQCPCDFCSTARLERDKLEGIPATIPPGTHNRKSGSRSPYHPRRNYA